jgi:hypothetical protein
MENRKASVNVEPDWNLLEEIDLPALTKLNVRIWGGVAWWARGSGRREAEGGVGGGGVSAGWQRYWWLCRGLMGADFVVCVVRWARCRR